MQDHLSHGVGMFLAGCVDCATAIAAMAAGEAHDSERDARFCFNRGMA